MMRRECISTSTSAAMDDLREFMKSQLEDFKVESEKMLARMKKDLKKLAAGDSAKKQIRNKAERMRKTGQAQNQNRPQSDFVGAGSAMDADEVASKDSEIDNVEAEEERNGLIISNNEEEIDQDAGLEDPSTVNGRRKSQRAVKEPAWMKDFMTI